jgi:hypothetical protein
MTDMYDKPKVYEGKLKAFEHEEKADVRSTANISTVNIAQIHIGDRV